MAQRHMDFDHRVQAQKVTHVATDAHRRPLVQLWRLEFNGYFNTGGDGPGYEIYHEL